MARLFGLIGNRTDLAGRVLASEADALRVQAKGQPLGWGIGFYQGGEVLMRRRPIDDHGTIEVAKLAADVRADLLIGHVRNATVGALRTENTHPFRYRQWLFAQTGTLPLFDVIRERLVASVPEFLRSSIRGESDAEILFYVFLSFLHDAGRLTAEGPLDPAHVREALRSSVAVVDGMAAEVGGAACTVNLMASNGEDIFALHRGAAMGYRVFSGKNDAEALIGDDLALRRKTPELGQMHFLLLASDFDDDWSMTPSQPGAHSRWKVLPERAIVTLQRGKDPHIDSA
jgi:predicted glutamine amidotransferase